MKALIVIILVAIAVTASWLLVRDQNTAKNIIAEGGLNLSITPSTQPNNSPDPNMTNSNPDSEAVTNPEDLPETIKATIRTKVGSITLDLYPQVAPKTVANFLNLASTDFYAGTTFHRVVSGFVIQGGDPLSKDADPSNDGTGGPGYVFEDEINPQSLGLSASQIAQLEASGYVYDGSLESIPMKAGVIAMANSGPNTNGSQFFIVTEKDQPHLDGRHTVFGRVTAGLDVARAIQQGEVIQAIEVSL